MDFETDFFRKCQNLKFEPAPVDGAFPEGFYPSTNFPTYVKINGKWTLPLEPRMDSALYYDKKNDKLYLREMCRIRKGDLIGIARKEDGTEGIYVDDKFEEAAAGSHSKFAFMSSEVSREKPVDYGHLAKIIHDEKKSNGYVVWVLGPATVLSRCRKDMSWLIENGYVNAVLAGNAVGVHDIEASIFGTTLGMEETGDLVAEGHATHMRAINKVRIAGSIKAAVEKGIIKDGIMYSCVKHGVPFVLAGSIRDDGPLPETVTNVLDSQKAMREHTKKATMVVMVATMLHSIATGNMTPAYYERDGKILPLKTICVDQSEFVVNKLKDRGTHQAYGIVRNAQDFLRIIVEEIKAIKN